MSDAPKKTIGKNDYVWVRSIFGKGPDAKKRYEFIPSGGMNDVVKVWQDAQPEHQRDVASPSTITMCPRVIWLQNRNLPPTNEMTWAVKQRMLLGRLFENQFAQQLGSQGMLLKHWKDDPGEEVEKFVMGKGLQKNQGVPDYLLQLHNIVAVSDAKTSRSDSFGYIGFTEEEIFEDWGWYKYRLQLTDYFMLCHANKEWFEVNKLPLPTHCHLFSYALDDGVVRREVTWEPTEHDKQEVLRLTKRYNEAIASETMPDCTCAESFDNFDVKFCRYGVLEDGKKIAGTCCSDTLIDRVEG